MCVTGSPTSLPPPAPCPQAADPDVEAVVLHATAEDGTKAHPCRGAGSYKAMLACLGEPLPESEPAPAPEAETARQAEAAQELPQAATVS